MRWPQAEMFYALTNLLLAETESTTEKWNRGAGEGARTPPRPVAVIE